MRLIDADALVAVESRGEYLPTAFRLGEARIIALIENAPTIEAEPVKHGRWIEHTAKGENMAGEIVEIIISCNCSECRSDGGYRSNYCPNCGVKMDLEDTK